MANTTYEYVSGKVTWSHLHLPNQYGDYKITLYPDQPSLAKILQWKEKGLKNKLRKDDSGTSIDFKRVSQKLIRGKSVAFAAPDVLDKNGIPMPGVPIGHGSDITAKLEMYTYHPLSDRTKEELAARLVAIKVHDLVPFTDKDFRPEEAKAVSGLKDQPAPQQF
jgi:hypothetical protein